MAQNHGECFGPYRSIKVGFAPLFGLGIGNATSLPPLIAQQEFPSAETTCVVPLIVAISQASCAFAPGSVRSAAWA